MLQNKEDLSTVKIIDFGLSTKLMKGQSLDGLQGTPYYLAPEIIYGFSYKEKVDMWALGVIAYKLIDGKYPFLGKNFDKLFKSIMQG